MSAGARRLPLTTLHFSCYMRGRRRGVPMAALTRTLCLTVLIAFGASIISAQTATGGIRGFAKDDTGGVLAGGNGEQSVTVTGESPVVDALHAGVTSNFNKDWLQSVPTARQSYFDVVTYAPSVKINQVPNDSRFVIFGSSSDQNSFQYEGVEISAVSNGGVWDFPSPDMMQEVEVKAVGVSAEYSNFQGGVVNIVLKSGGNQFHGIES